MKKFFILMAIVLPFVVVSCDDDKDEPMLPEEHEWVDLGLPSGTLWATCNIGAKSPEEYGDYFAWGETAPKDYYSYGTNMYKWYKSDDNCPGLTKYCTNSEFGSNGFIDDKTELEPSDDAAYVNWGSSWRIPSWEQIQELLKSCSWQWTQRNGVNGQLGMGPNGNTIFLPATGCRPDNLLDGAGSYGRLWSRTLCSDDTFSAYSLRYCPIVMEDIDEYWYSGGRCDGFGIRPVRVSQN